MLRFIHTRFHLGVSSCSHPPFSLIISHGGATIVRRPPPVAKPNQTNPQPKKKKRGEWGSFGMTLLYSSPDPSFCFVVVVVVMGSVGCLVGLLGEEVLLEQDAELLAEGLELLEVLLVLALVLDLGFDACVGGVSLSLRGGGGYGMAYPQRRGRRWGSRRHVVRRGERPRGPRGRGPSRRRRRCSGCAGRGGEG